MSSKFNLFCFLTSLFIWVSGQSVVAQSKAGIEVQIAQLMQEQQDSWNRGDLEGFMQHYWRSDSLMFIGSQGVTYGWNSTLENYNKSYPDKDAMGTLTFTVLSIQPLSVSSCFVIGKWHLKRNEDEPHGLYTLLWKKIDRKWVITIDHSS